MIEDRVRLVPELRAALMRLRRCDDADQPHIRQVLAVPMSVFRQDLVGLASVSISGETWEPDPDGDSLAFITPAFAFGRLVDLIAWHPASPQRWASRLGIADCLGRPHWERCRVFRTVLGWLVNGGEGIVPLEPGALRCLYPQPETLVAEDAAHRREIIRALTVSADLPRVIAA